MVGIGIGIGYTLDGWVIGVYHDYEVMSFFFQMVFFWRCGYDEVLSSLFFSKDL